MVVLLSVLVNSINFHNVSKRVDVTSREDLVTGEIVIAYEGLTGLLDLTAVRKLLSTKKAGKRVETIILVVSFSDFNSVVSQVIVDNERTVFRSAVETEDFSIVIQELLLRLDLASTKLLLEILEHEGVTLGCNRDLFLIKSVFRALLGFGARLSTFLNIIQIRHQRPTEVINITQRTKNLKFSVTESKIISETVLLM
jgi:hypothetical protein